MTIETLSQSQQPDSVTVVDNRLDSLPMLITIAHVAEILGISRSAAYRCAASGDLPTTHLGGRVYVITAQLRLLFESS